MLKHREIPEVYREYGLRMIQKGSVRAQPSLKTWMKETASQVLLCNACNAHCECPLVQPTAERTCLCALHLRNR